jgi:predicted secreted protein
MKKMIDKFLAENKPNNFGFYLFGVFCPPVNCDVYAVVGYTG